MASFDGGPAGSLPAAVVQAVQQAASATFGLICGVEPDFQGASDAGGRWGPRDGLVGIMPFAGDLAWSLMLELPRQTAAALAPKFAGFDIPFDSADMGDAVGEITNVLAGDVEARLSAAGMKAELTLPTVVRGRDMDLLLPEGAPSMRLTFALPDGAFWLTLARARPRRE
jgi:CheY-specific phosphatase CheX